MTQIAIDSLDRPRPSWSIRRAFNAIGAAIDAQLRFRRVRQTVIAELEQYSADEIAELGISRADIAFIAEDAARR